MGKSVGLALLGLVACGGNKDADSGGAPSADELEYAELGEFGLSDTGAYTGDVAVEVPEGAVSSVFYCEGYGDQAIGAIWEVKDPAGTLVYSGDAPDITRFRSEFTDDMAVGLLPQTPNLELTAGTWQVNWFVGKGNSRSVSCGAVHRVDTVSAKSTLAVDLVFVGAAGLTAASAQEDPAFQQVITSFTNQWATGDLKPVFNYVDFSGDVEKFRIVDVTDTDYSEFNDLLRTTNPDNPRTLTFFLVDEIANASAGGATILGLAAGPPGAAGVQGSSKSGVIVSAIDYAAAPEDVAKIMAHEGGHFLGLYHTTEKDAAKTDPLGDTPECPLSNDANGNGQMNSSECAGLGAENIMWWTLTTGEPSFSGDQAWVLARNPLSD